MTKTKKNIFKPNYKQIKLNFTFLSILMLLIFSIKYSANSINFVTILKYMLIVFIIGIIIVYQLAKKVEIDGDHIIIKNIITNKSYQILGGDIVSISEKDHFLGGMLTHRLVIKTKDRNFILYPEMLCNYHIFKKNMEEIISPKNTSNS